MKTIIAEKPSVAREIARIVGATKREEGYFEGGGYAVRKYIALRRSWSKRTSFTIISIR